MAFYLETKRLILLQPPLEILKTRLQKDAFTGEVQLPDRTLEVTFPSEWPGEALVLFPLLIEQYNQSARIPWGGIMIEKTERVAIGQMGFKDLPDEHGMIEIGYGINPSYQNCGYATEGVKTLVAWALAQDEVQRVTAECRTGNHGSIRVLEKADFQRCGERIDEEDGHLILWERKPYA